jgi:hypothetical protein
MLKDAQDELEITAIHDEAGYRRGEVLDLLEN